MYYYCYFYYYNYIYIYIYIYIHVKNSQQGWHTTKYILPACFDAHYVLNFTVKIQ